MDIFAKIPNQERQELIAEAALRLNLSEIVVEKDFWVCWTLKHLFSCSDLASFLTFKGGTSLSKAYGMIERFSEDIDLTIHRDATFLSDVPDPMESAISNNERGRRIDHLKKQAQRFVHEIVQPAFQTIVERELGEQVFEGMLVLDDEDPDRQTLLFYYPASVESEGYIRPRVKLEFGARGQIEPNEVCEIQPYIADVLPKEVLGNPVCSVNTLSVVRTFWEKATILHAVHHGSKMRDRMSRHYYDTFMLYQQGVAEKALERADLLADVVQNKSLLFKDTKASYETAQIGSLKLLPHEDNVSILKSDYALMDEMFMGDPPQFEEMMRRLQELEALLNTSLGSSA